MVNVLSDYYLPENVLHRDEQLNKIKGVFSNFEKFKAGTNLLILGVSGSGKTTIVRKVSEESDNSLFISCNETKTTFKTLKHMFNLKQGQYHHDILEKIIEILKDSPKILIFDEIDKLTDFQLFMNDLNAIYRRTMCPIVLVSFKRDIISRMPVDAVKTLFFDKITLKSYNALELQDIIKERLKLLEIDMSNIPDDFIPYLSAMAGRQGSCRLALHILFKSLQYGTFTRDFIKQIYDNFIQDDWDGFYDDLNETEQKFLSILKGSCSHEIETGAEELKKELEKQLKHSITGARVSQLINTFEKYSVVVSRHKNMGRAGGRKRLVKFVSEKTFQEISGIVPY